VYAHHGGPRVVLAGEERLLLQPRDITLERRHRAFELGLPVVVVRGHLEQAVELARLDLQLGEEVELVLRTRDLGRDSRRPALVVPEVRLHGLGLELGLACAQCIRVKGNHEPSATGL